MIGPHNENARVVLECETSGGYPEPTLTWWRDGRLVDDSYEILSALDGSVLEERRGSASNPAPSSSNAGDERATRLAAETQHQAGGASRGTKQSNSMDQQEQATSTATTSTATAAATTSAARQQPNRLMRNRLELASITRDDLLANYSCQARNSQLGEPPTSYVMIDMNRKYLMQFCSLAGALVVEREGLPCNFYFVSPCRSVTPACPLSTVVLFMFFHLVGSNLICSHFAGFRQLACCSLARLPA